ncbi:uncharacterized protein [Aegilops tauschii subsp. strangulata]|uniref:uncharacterized protein n=1 Tax=Aegilops tauschii subsp. strangulata TaxID=200361 RepID=UPI003CC8654D
MECIRILSKRTIGGSGDAGAGEAPAQRMKLRTEVVVAADEVSRGQQRNLDFIAVVVPPQPKPEVHSYSDNDSDGKLIGMYTDEAPASGTAGCRSCSGQHGQKQPRPGYEEPFLSPALDRLEELSFHVGRPRSLPPSALHLAPMLHRTTFTQCIFPRIDVVRALHLPKLKHLELMVVRISKKDLERLLVGCTSLEYLRLQAMDGFSSLHITSTNVRAIYVHCWHRPRLSVEVFHDTVIENAPFLERLYVLDKLGPTRIRVIHAPK